MKPWVAAAAALFVAAPHAALAEDDEAPSDRPEFERTLIPKPLRHARWSALVDGGWSVLMTLSWIQSARVWDNPQPEGWASLIAARVLYGTTGSVLLAGELSLFTRAFEADWHRLSKGRFRNEWWVGLSTPSGCAGRRSLGCGFGLGGSSELSVRIDETLELALVSGWIQGRVEDDETHTVLESTWFQGPFVARWVHTFGDGPVRLTTALGGGLFFGLRVAHPRPKGPRPEGPPPIELVVFDGGVGAGLSSRAWLHLPYDFELTLDLDLVPFAGRARAQAPTRAEPVVAAAGVPIYRRASVGLGFPPIGDAPVRLSARLAMVELSARPLSKFGHWLTILAFEVPFVLEPKPTEED